MIKLLPQVSRTDVVRVGGKAANLGEMIQAGIQVPPGFVLTTEAFRSGMLEVLEKKILQAFDELGVQRVAVRSSAVAEDSSTASWAGQLDTYLNVHRADLIEAIRKCWQSINSKHAKSYADENNVSEAQRAVAVVVQAMVDSDVSGVLFTANPVSNNRDECVIEAVYGLGELLVQGSETPESVIVNKKSGEVLERQPHRQQQMLVYKNGKNQTIPVPTSKTNQAILGDRQLQELLAAAKQIEKQYGSPQDIEWALSGGKLYIVQSRPITTFILPETQILKDAKLTDHTTPDQGKYYLGKPENLFYWGPSRAKPLYMADFMVVLKHSTRKCSKVPRCRIHPKHWRCFTPIKSCGSATPKALKILPKRRSWRIRSKIGWKEI